MDKKLHKWQTDMRLLLTQQVKYAKWQMIVFDHCAAAIKANTILIPGTHGVRLPLSNFE